MKYHIFPTIIGVIIGGLSAFIFRLLWSPPIGRPLLVLLFWSWTPIFFLAIYSYIMMTRFSSLWEDSKTRLLNVYLAIFGYAIGWYMIGLPHLAPGVLKESIFSVMSYFLVGIFTGIFISIYTFSYYYQNALATTTSIIFALLLALLVTKDIKSLIKRIILAIVLIFLMFWPRGIIIPT